MKQILKHHADNLLKEMKLFPDAEDLRMRLVSLACDLPLIVQEGKQAYPALGLPERRAAFVEAQIKQARALRDGTAVIIPEQNPDGSENVDSQCKACGNLGEDNVCLHSIWFQGNKNKEII